MDKTAIVILFAFLVTAIVALGGYITMLWLGVIYGNFDILAPLGYFESLGTIILTTMVAGLVFPNSIERS